MLGLAQPHRSPSTRCRRRSRSGNPITRQAYASSSLWRLALISVAGFAIAAIYWPDGAAVIFGLAIFHLIALMLTAIPLLREVRNS